MKKNNAFTLVELIIVIFITALFMGVAAPSVFSWVNSSKVKVDSNTCIEIQQIVVDSLKGDYFMLSNEHSKLGFLSWNTANKAKLRTILQRELGTATVPVPRRDKHAFFVYLLPPYTVTCFPVTNVTNIDSSSFSLSNLTNDYLLKNFPKSKYPQMYSSSYVETVNAGLTVGSISVPTLQTPTFLKPDASVYNNLINSYVGCINLPEDYN